MPPGSREILFVTGNQHKVEEANRILFPLGLKVKMADCEKIEIQSNSLASIAEYAAMLAAKKMCAPVIVEDSGLFIGALGGFPGPYSSFVFKTLGCEGVLRLLHGIPNRGSSFQCAVSYCLPDAAPKTFGGRADGAISANARGSMGFGFDPIFLPSKGGGRTFAELSMEEKGLLSHRGAAFRGLGAWLSSRKENSRS
jgi:XTP/dITP diphosphohydrolase